MKNILIITLMFTVHLLSQISTPPSIGDGSSGNPYEITNLNNLYWIASDAANWDKNYIQTENIDAFETESWFDGSGWIPIGNNDINFIGTYDGQEHFIDDIYINRDSNYQGLFGYLYNSRIENLGVSNIMIDGGNNMYLGGITGCCTNTEVNDCYATGDICGVANTGGLIGEAENSDISNCYSMVDGVIGGLVGSCYILTVNFVNCYSTGFIETKYHSGGFVGWGGNADNSFWDVVSSGTDLSSCGIGKTPAEMKNTDTFTSANWDFTDIWDHDDRYNSGYPYLKWQVFPSEPILKTIEVSEVSVNSAKTGVEIINIGLTDILNYGICWNTMGSPSLANDHTDGDTLTLPGSFIIELSDLSNNTKYFVKGYATNLNGTAYGKEISFSTLPIQPEEPIGNGSELLPYRIENLRNLFWIAESDERWNFNYVQIADIDAIETSKWYPDSLLGPKGWGFNPINLSGTYDGQFHIINGLFINRPESDNMGLFGSGVIKNLGLTNFNITGNNKVGCLLGEGSAENCFSTKGIVVGNYEVGGLIGRSYDNWNLNCYSSGIVTGYSNVGGLIGVLGYFEDGYYFGYIRNCYSLASVSGSLITGGLVGSEIASIFNCFWDIEVSGQDSSAAGIGKTTVEMKSIATYTDADWDFSTIWGIDTVNNDGYPYLIWQDFTGIEPNANIPTSLVLFQNYPNPFNPETVIKYSLEKNSMVKLIVYDIAGRIVKELVDQKQNQGFYKAKFNGDMLISGMYFYRLSIDGAVIASKKMMMIK